MQNKSCRAHRGIRSKFPAHRHYGARAPAPRGLVGGCHPADSCPATASFCSSAVRFCGAEPRGACRALCPGVMKGAPGPDKASPPHPNDLIKATTCSSPRSHLHPNLIRSVAAWGGTRWHPHKRSGGRRWGWGSCSLTWTRARQASQHTESLCTLLYIIAMCRYART